MLTRVQNGYLPGTMDVVYLCHDIDELDAAIDARKTHANPLLAQSAEIESEARRLRVPDLIAKSLLQRSKILLNNKRYREAIPVLTEADRSLGNLRQHDLKIYILAGLAEAHAGMENWNAVSAFCAEGIARVEGDRYKFSGQYVQSAYLRSRITLYANGVRAQFESGKQHYDSMLRWAELSKCRSILRASQRYLLPNEEEKEIELQFRRVCREIDELHNSEDDQAAETLEMLRAQRRALWDLLLIQREESTMDAPEFDLLRLQARLAHDEAVLYYYWLDQNDLLVVAIDRDQVNAQIVTQPELRGKLDAFCEGIYRDMNFESAAFWSHLNDLQDFSGVLLPPGARKVFKEKTRLVISPHRVLHAVPFQALPWDDEHRSLIERFSMAYTPNLTCLLVPYIPSSQRNLLALGIDKFNVRLDHVPDLAAVRAKPTDLDGAEAEVSDLESLYRHEGHAAIVWRGANATENNLHRAEQTGGLSEFTTLHFATHGFNVNSDRPMESVLILYDSVLDGLEIANWRLRAELVVLSACSSGQRAIKGRGMNELPGDDLFGLQAAFFAAGAKCVLGSLWPVRSDVARTIMTAFHRFLLGGHSPDLALQKATLEYIGQAKLRMRKSCFWAPFFLTTVGRPA